MFYGAITAFNHSSFRSGQQDEDALRNIVRWQIDQVSNAFVPVGTLESSTLSENGTQTRD